MLGRSSTWSRLHGEASTRKVNTRAQGLVRKKLWFTFSEEIEIGRNEEKERHHNL